MTVADILAKWLKDNGYDGLVHPESECGCKVSDLVPCDSPCHGCQPGYRGPDLVSGGSFAIYPSKEARDKAVLDAKGAGDADD